MEATGLSPHDRSVVTLAALIARNRTIEMPKYLSLALDNGVKPREIAEIITHLAFYSGWANAVSADAIVRNVFAERNIGAEHLSSASPKLLPLDQAAEEKREPLLKAKEESMSKRPHIICHMASSLDGKIDGGALRNVMRPGEYESLHSKLEGDAWICGRTTMQQHFADAEPFVSITNTPAGTPSIHVARRADSYGISVDTLGKLRWTKNEIDGDHIICVLSERVSSEYLATLRDNGVSYIVTGQDSVDLANAVEALAEHFGIRNLLLEGGGHINGGFLQAGLVDEISLLLLPGIDGRHDIPAVFDGVEATTHTSLPFKLKSVERRDNDALWLRYDVVRK